MFHFYIPKSHGLSCLVVDKREPEETGKKPKDFILYDDLCSVIKHTVLKQAKDFTNDLMRSAIIAKEWEPGSEPLHRTEGKFRCSGCIQSRQQLRRSILHLSSRQKERRENHLLSPFLSDRSLKNALEILACRIFISKSLAHLSPFFPHLTGGGNITYLPWIHRDLTDEGSPKKWFLFSALSDRTRFHISEKFYSGTFWQLPCCYIVTSPPLHFWLLLLRFSPACPDRSRTALSAAGKQCWHFTSLGLCPP